MIEAHFGAAIVQEAGCRPERFVPREILRPRFEKVLHGPGIARKIGIDRIRADCAHFSAWLTRIEALTPLEVGES